MVYGNSPEPEGAITDFPEPREPPGGAIPDYITRPRDQLVSRYPCVTAKLGSFIDSPHPSCLLSIPLALDL